MQGVMTPSERPSISNAVSNAHAHGASGNSNPIADTVQRQLCAMYALDLDLLVPAAATRCSHLLQPWGRYSTTSW